MINLDRVKNIYFVGIKGVAMTALAIVAKERGIAVSGVDLAERFPTDETLHNFGISYHTHFDSEHVTKDINLVVYTGAHEGRNNLEVKRSIELGIPILPHGQALGLFMKEKRGISVAGSHGKTTTSAMIASILESASRNPSFAVGCGAITALKTPARWGSGEWFVAEADEYVTDPQFDPTPRFLWQHPEALVITNIDYDHPDVYENLEAVQKSFAEFVNQLPAHGHLFVNLDDLSSRELVSYKKSHVHTFGQNIEAEYQFKNIKIHEGYNTFDLFKSGKLLYQFKIQVPGVHNIANAAAAIATLDVLGVPVAQIAEGLEAFRGTKRRFEFITEKNGKLLYDDYAHHPKEIMATIAAAREWFPKRQLIVIFQPHTFSRTKQLFVEFTQSFAQADQIVIADIYASAREELDTTISAQMLVKALQENGKEAVYRPNISDVLEYSTTQTRQNDLIVMMGAGDIYTWVSEVAKAL